MGHWYIKCYGPWVKTADGANKMVGPWVRHLTHGSLVYQMLWSLGKDGRWCIQNAWSLGETLHTWVTGVLNVIIWSLGETLGILVLDGLVLWARQLTHESLGY